MFIRSIAILVATLAIAPSVAGAQMQSPMPKASGMQSKHMKSSKPMKKPSSMSGSSMSGSTMKSGDQTPVTSNKPGAPNNSGSSPLGSSQSSPAPK